MEPADQRVHRATPAALQGRGARGGHRAHDRDADGHRHLLGRRGQAGGQALLLVGQTGGRRHVEAHDRLQVAVDPDAAAEQQNQHTVVLHHGGDHDRAHGLPDRAEHQHRARAVAPDRPRGQRSGDGREHPEPAEHQPGLDR